ncbi:MAG: Flp family type IVb pilin [Cohaesibacter sp.]|nr:Flp family type IVb pilin [Cohaesibacter sp.]
MTKTFLKDESGATAIEYAVLAAFLGLAMVAAGSEVNSALQTAFARLSGDLDAAAADPSAPSLPPIADPGQ